MFQVFNGKKGVPLLPPKKQPSGKRSLDTPTQRTGDTDLFFLDKMLIIFFLKANFMNYLLSWMFRFQYFKSLQQFKIGGKISMRNSNVIKITTYILKIKSPKKIKCEIKSFL